MDVSYRAACPGAADVRILDHGDWLRTSYVLVAIAADSYDVLQLENLRCTHLGLIGRAQRVGVIRERCATQPASGS